MVDTLINAKLRRYHQFCSFYTESDPILTYMVNRLNIVQDDVILEPCAGDGVFIQKIISNKNLNFSIDALDLNPLAVDELNRKFKTDTVHVRLADTLLDPMLDLFMNSNGYYTKIIGNPPYGAWQDYDKRDLLKKIYGGYVRETYTLFIKRCIDVLRERGRLVFIVPDTFLALHLHRDTREKMLRETQIEEILLIPSNFFPGVNFGYSNLCIITLQKKLNFNNNKVKIVSISDDVNKLYELAKDNFLIADEYEEIDQGNIKEATDLSFLLGGNKKIRKLVNGATIHLGDIADCVTGFYSGNNQRFLAIQNQNTKRSKDSTIIPAGLVEFDYLDQDKILDGLLNNKEYIPILKGGGSRFIKKTEWFVKWDKQTVSFYRKDKKARFQNSQYYFRSGGIGVPMVKTNHLNAFLLEGRLFDQSIVGIFPKDKKKTNYILAFLNSNVCSRIMKTINHTANNSANYIKRIPILINDESVKEIDLILNNHFEFPDENRVLKRINMVFDQLYQI